VTRTRGLVALGVATVIWGATFPMIKAALADVSPLTFNALRFGLASLFLIPNLRALDAATLRAGAVLGFFLCAGFALQTVGLETTTPSRSAFLTALNAPFTPMVGLVLGGPRPAGRAIAAVFLALIGTGLLTGAFGDASALSVGDWLTVGCAICFAIQIEYSARSSRRHPAAQLMVGQVIGAAVIGLPLVPLMEHPHIHWTPFLSGAVAVEVFLATLLCLRLQLAGQKVVSATQAAIVFALEPVIAAMTSRLTLGERLTLVQWVGGGLILLALLLSSVGAHAESEGGVAA
jgi:drug/metabolite transporter (DMT)-like permease